MSTLRGRVGRVRPGRRTTQRAVRPAAEPQDPGAPVAVEPEAIEPTADQSPAGGPADVDEDGLKVRSRRAGIYVVTDASGLEVGRIRGDYVVGFTTEYGGRMRWFEDLETARLAVVDEYQRDRAHSA